MRVLQPGRAFDFETFVTYPSISSSYSINTLVLSLPVKDLIFIGKIYLHNFSKIERTL